MPSRADASLRRELVRYARLLQEEGLVSGTSGNLSVRLPARDAYLITPSGLRYEALEPGDLVTVGFPGRVSKGQLKPSTDTPIHLAVYRSRRDVGAIVHTHSPYACVFAVLRREIPPLLLEAAGFLGGAVQVMGYVPPASPSLADEVVASLGQDRAILLPHHGVLAVGETLDKAFAAARLVEHSARIAFLVNLLGRPSPLPASDIERMHRFLHGEYGQQP